MAIELPKKKVPAEFIDPRFLVIYSKPKQGKTRALSMLDNNLIIDTESGTAFMEALKVDVTSIKDILEVCKAIKEAGKPYKYITLDTVTALEDMAKPYAINLWKQSPEYTDKYIVNDITKIPHGSGYKYLREAIWNVINWLRQCADHVILVCHSKDATIRNDEITVKDIDLLGKSSSTISAKCDGVGYLYRDEFNNTRISFEVNNKFAECIARPDHLANKDILLVENIDGKLIPHWDRIFKSEPYSGEDVARVDSTSSIVDDMDEESESNEEEEI